MLSIGEFSKICKVSTKTLRYYDEIGLLKPTNINLENGYRNYSIKQLEDMLLINKLKMYQFSLEEIKELLNFKDNNLELFYTKLNNKKSQIQKSINDSISIISEIDRDLDDVKNGKSLNSYLQEIKVKEVIFSNINILSKRVKVSYQDCLDGYNKFFSPLFNEIIKNKWTIKYAPMTIYHSDEYKIDGYDIEFAIALDKPNEKTKSFSPGMCLKSVLKGSYSNITSAYIKQKQFCEKYGYESTKKPFDVYISNPYKITNIQDLITEIYMPVKKIKERVIC